MMRVTKLNRKEARASGCWIRLSHERRILVKAGWMGMYGVTVDFNYTWVINLNKNLNDLLGIWPEP
jgi:hypothetical protein